MIGPFAQALLVLKWATALIGQFSPIDVVLFNEPDPTVNDALLLGFDFEPEPLMRRCCAIGWEPSVGGAPKLIATKALDLSGVGIDSHRYGGPRLSPTPSTLISEDPVGHIYTQRGGLIDLAHMRDHADLTRFLAIKALRERGNEGQIRLSDEAGERHVKFKLMGKPVTPRISALLGARISYDCAIWHEIVTWAATSGFSQQPYSAFSPEDNYSNLLGTYIGYRAMFSTKPYNTAISEVFAETLLRLVPATRQETLLAVEYVKDRWYRYDLTGDLELMRRHFGALGTVTPWLITEVEQDGADHVETLRVLREALGQPGFASPIVVPEDDSEAGPLADLYEFRVDPDGTIPASFFEGRSHITGADFPALIAKVKQEVLAQYSDGDKP